MRVEPFSPSVVRRGIVPSVTGLALGLFLLLTCGKAAEPAASRVESDWLRQDLLRPSGQGSALSTQSDAAGGVDGVKNGRWGFHTAQDKSPWWQVDLGKEAALDRVLVYNSCHEPMRAVRLKVLVSSDGKAWREVYSHDGSVFRGQPDNKPLTVPLKGATARFVRIQLPGPQWLHLDEVEVYGQADPKRNLALGRPADQSSTSEWSVAKTQTPVGDDVHYPVAAVLERGKELLTGRRRQGIDVAAAARALEEVTASASSVGRTSVRPEGASLGGRTEVRPTTATTTTERDLYLQARGAVRKLVLADPRLNFDKLLFVKRFTYHSSHIYTDHFDGSSRMGGNLCILSPVAPDGKVTEIAPQLAGGIFGRFDLSFDARRVVFAYKAPGKGYRIFEIGVDGSGLRPLTHDAPDEAEMVRRYGHGYDDMDPCYLPNGKIMFVSTRTKRGVLCHNAFTCTALHVMDADGGNLHCVSGNTVNEFAPCVMDDGRVIYTRWEYVDKGCGDVQSLWSLRPDGSGPAHVYKNNVALPSTLIDARSIPGSHRLVAVGAPHMPLAVGPVVLVDIHVSQRTPAAMTNLTPEIGYPPHAGYPGAKFGYYKEPYPLGEDLFLVSYNPGPNHSEPAGYGIYVLDGAGQRELIYQDRAISSFQPIPLRPRPVPPNIAAVATEPEPKTSEEMATLFLADVYQGLAGIPRGSVKYLRVMEDVPKPWEPGYESPGRGDSCGLQNPVISLKGHFTVKRILGLIRVEEDGSAFFRVPANKNLYFQALDAKYMELQRMRTFVNLMPGEQRSCIGCHEFRKLTPSLKRSSAVALEKPIQELVPQPGDHGPRTIHYPRDVQTVLDKHCVACHGGASPKGNLDLTGEPTELFTRSYENLINRKLINNIDVDPRSAYIPAEPPLSFGSHRSKLAERIQSPPCRANLTEEEFVRIITWIDANAPFYGLYEGKRNVRWKGQPDYRPDPLGQ